MNAGVDLEAHAPSKRRYEPAASDGVLFEREPALGLLQSSLDGLEAGRGSVVALVGGHGSGKSALLASAARTAADRGLRLLAASGTRARARAAAGRGAPALRDPPRGRERRRARAADAGSGARLRCRSSKPARPPGTPRPPARSCTASTGSRRTSPPTEPLVLVIDDVDMADAATLRFVLYLVGRLEAVPVVAAHRLWLRRAGPRPRHPRRGAGASRDAALRRGAAQRRGHRRLAAGLLLPGCRRSRSVARFTRPAAAVPG